VKDAHVQRAIVGWGARRWIHLLAVLLAGCAPTVVYAPRFVDRQLDPSSISEITVLPAVDLRIERSIRVVDLQAPMLRPTGLRRETIALNTVLSKRGHAVRYAETLGEVGSITRDDLTGADQSWIAKLGGPENRWILLIVLHDLASTSGFGAAVVAECQGVLYDKQVRRAMWSHSGEGRIEIGGFIVMMLRDIAIYDAMATCTKSLMEQFPPKKL
jgi:hypothetical protein